MLGGYCQRHGSLLGGVVMAKKDFIPFQPISGVPVAQEGSRFYPLEPPVDKGCNDDRTVFWFIYQGESSGKKGKLTINVDTWEETFEEVE